MSNRYGRGRPSRGGPPNAPRGGPRATSPRERGPRGLSGERGHRVGRSERGERGHRGNERGSRRGDSVRERTPPRRRRDRRGSFVVRHEDPNIVMNQILRKLERNDRRERTHTLLQIQQFCEEGSHSAILELRCIALITLLEPIIEETVGTDNEDITARTFGAIGRGLGQQCGEYISWLTAKVTAPNTTNLSFLLKAAGCTADSEGSCGPGILPLIDTLIELLERTAQPQTVTLLLNAIIPLSECYTAFFIPHFQNIVDILIGWHIDSAEQIALQDTIGGALVKFKPFWMSDLTFPLTLIMQFVEDAEKEQLEIKEDGEGVKRFISFLKVFHVLLTALTDGISVSQGIPDFLCKLMNRIVTSSTALLSVVQSPGLITVIAGCSLTVTKVLHSHFGMVCDQLICFLLDTLEPLPPYQALYASLRAILNICDTCPSCIGASILSSMLQPSSPLVVLRTDTNEQILATLFNIFHSLLQLHNFKLLDIVYQFIVKDLHIAIEMILSTTECESNRKEAEILASSDLALLSEIAGSKTHGFSTWALNPNIFQLVTSVHSPHNWILAKTCPSVHYGLLNVLHAECKRHGYFLPGAGSSEISHTQNAPSQLSRVLSLLSLLLPHPSLSYDSRYFCLLWVKRLVEIMKKAGECPDTLAFCNLELQDLTISLIKVADDKERDIRLEVAGCLRLLLLGQLLSSHTQRHCLAVSLLHMGDVDGATRGAFVGVLEAVSPQLLLGYEIDSLNMDRFTLRNLLHTRHSLVYNCETSMVSSNQFALLMRLILLNIIPGKFIHDDWLERLFHATSSTAFVQGVSPCDSVLWFWFMWQLALFAVNSKLKTPLGKATETFESVEGIMVEILEGVAGWEDSTSRGIISGIGSHCYVSLLRTTLLLHFISNLEKLIYNAYEGTVHAIIGLNKAVRNFFILNRTTCEEWLARIRPTIAQVCSNTGMFAEAWRHSQILLTQPASLITAVRAALNLRSPGHIQGLKTLYGDCLYLLNGAQLQATGHYEEAAECYKAELKQSKMSSEHRTFIAQQTLDCYLNLADWDRVNSWYDEYSKELTNTIISREYLSALNSFDLGDFNNVAKWLQKVPGGNITNLAEEFSRKGSLRVNQLPLELEIPRNAEPSSLLYLSQLQLLRVCGLYHTSGEIQLVGGDDRSDEGSYSDVEERTDSSLEKGPEFIFRKLLRQASSLVEVGVRIAGVDLPVLIPSGPAVQLQCVSALHQLLLCDTVKAPTGVPLNLTTKPLKLDPRVHEAGSWTQLYRYAHHIYQYFEPCNGDSKWNMLSSQMILNLGVGGARLARKQGNVRLSQRLMISELSWHITGVHPSRPPITTPILYIADIPTNGTDVVRSTLHTALSTSLSQYVPVDLLPIHSQSAKLLYHCGCHSEAIEALSAAVLYKQRNPNFPRNSNNNDAMRCVLSLCKWLSRDATLGLMALSPQFPCLQTLLEAESTRTAHSPIQITYGVTMSEVKLLEGRLLRFVVEEARELANGWEALATWAYDICKKTFDQLNLSRGEEMLPDERFLVEGIAGENTDKVWSVLVGTVISQNTDISNITSRLSTAAPKLDQGDISKLCDIHRQITDRLYNHYRISVKAYCRYLHLTADSQHTDITERVLSKTTHKEYTATLRLLKLLTSHVVPLGHQIGGEISHTPALQWHRITPQLLARLGHTDLTVRNALLQILECVATQYPHLLVHTCVERCSPRCSVDNAQNKSTFAEMMGLEEEEEEEEEITDNKPTNDSGYRQLYESLLKSSLDMVTDVQIIVQELRRINLLWSELWVGVLGHRHNDIHRKLAQLVSEIKRVNSNTTLSLEDKLSIAKTKQQALLKPIIVMLHRVQHITEEAAETNYEVLFQKKFSVKIKKAMDTLENCVDLKNPTKCWSLFEELHTQLQDDMQRSHSLSNISPRLAKLARLSTPLPGLDNDNSVECVTIERFVDEVHVLPTKTKPKKIAMLGSDGRKYTYLFKGLEDLRLDERVMQLLGVCNTMFTSHGAPQYRVRQYSVTPLGPRSGLIQWVGSASPLFSLYKRWQQRESIKKNPDTTPLVLNCSEIFYAKVNAVMTKWNITDKMPRSDWPAEMLLEVFKQLVEETPSDLLARELWCGSTSPTHWWSIMQQFTYTCAAMSMIGYVIGLGDRHLDNILVDFQQGDVVHIDYNVCFEKGRGLRVPERVSCRLTSNIQKALGTAGVEGSFRKACEEIMAILRNNKEIILSLLDAFVYDPLIEWTSANEDGAYAEAVKESNGASRKELERNVLYSLLSCRLAEVNVPLKNNRELFTTAITSLTTSLANFTTILRKISPQDASVNEVIARQRLLVEVKNDPDHSLWQLQERYEAQASHNSAHATLNGRVVSSSEEYTAQQCQFRAILEFIEGNVLDTLINQLSKSQGNGEPSYLPALEFLKSAGQIEMVQQTEQVDADINASITLRRNCTITALRALKPYGSIVSFFQRSFVDLHPCSFWCEWLSKVSHHPSAALCEEVCAQCQLSYDQITTLSSTAALSVEDYIKEYSNSLKSVLQMCLDQQSNLPLEVEDLGPLETKLLNERKDIVSLVLSSTLLPIASQWLVMEKSVCETSDIAALTTATGQWFLDQFVSTSCNVNALVRILCCGNDKFTDIQTALISTEKFIGDITEVYNKFSSIVLHETLKTLLCGDIDVIRCLEAYIQILDTALSDGLAEDAADIFTQLTAGTLDSTSPKVKDVLQGITNVKERVKNDFHTHDQKVPSYKGSLLIMCIEQLLSCTLDTMIEHVKGYTDLIGLFKEHSFVDKISAASELQYIGQCDHTVLYSAMYTTLIQAVLTYLKSCCLHVQLFDRTSDLTDALCWSSSDTLLHPIKQFLGVVLQTGGLGYPTAAIHYLIYQTFLELLSDYQPTDHVRLVEDLQRAVLDSVQSDGAQTILTQWEHMWHVGHSKVRLGTEIKRLKSNLQRCQLELIAFQWLHESSGLAGMPRQAFLNDLSAKLQVLKTCDNEVKEHKDTYELLEEKISQRLKWAAGANPSTKLILDLFQEAIVNRKTALDTESKNSSDVVEMCSAVITLETQRQETLEKQAVHESLMTMLRKFAESTALVEEYSKELEESTHLIHMLAAPEKGMTSAWLECELKECSKKLSSAISKQKSLNGEVKKRSEHLLGEIDKTKEQAATFVKLVADIAEHLSSLVKEEASDQGGARILLKSHQKLVSDLKQLLSNIKDFSSKTSKAKEQIELTLIDEWCSKVPMLHEDIVNISKLLNWIYEQLDAYAAGAQTITLPPSSLLNITPTNKTRIHKISEKNQYALNVLKRLQNKLEGREGAVILALEEQVSSVISSATSHYNLSHMYEGWTPWV